MRHLVSRKTKNLNLVIKQVNFLKKKAETESSPNTNEHKLRVDLKKKTTPDLLEVLKNLESKIDSLKTKEKNLPKKPENGAVAVRVTQPPSHTKSMKGVNGGATKEAEDGTNNKNKKENTGDSDSSYFRFDWIIKYIIAFLVGVVTTILYGRIVGLNMAIMMEIKEA